LIERERGEMGLIWEGWVGDGGVGREEVYGKDGAGEGGRGCACKVMGGGGVRGGVGG